MDDCDLYAERFDPVLRAEHLASYREVPANLLPVQGCVERRPLAEALVMVFPVWNFGLPAMLKGHFHRVLPPGVSLDMSDPRRIRPGLTHLPQVVGVATCGGPHWRVWLLGDGPRALVKRVMRRRTDGRARVQYLACCHLNVAGRDASSASMQRVPARRYPRRFSRARRDACSAFVQRVGWRWSASHDCVRVLCRRFGRSGTALGRRRDKGLCGQGVALSGGGRVPGGATAATKPRRCAALGLARAVVSGAIMKQQVRTPAANPQRSPA